MDLLAQMIKSLILRECGQLYLYLIKESGRYVYGMNHLSKYNSLNCEGPNTALHSIAYRYHKAIKDYDMALELDPRDAESLRAGHTGHMGTDMKKFIFN